MREKLSELEHIQWEKWSKTVAEELMQVYQLLTPIIKDKRAVDARKIIGKRLDRWKKNWIPYSDLTEEVKEFDREWADKVMVVVKKEIEESFFEGWDDLYGDDFSSNGVVNKEEWDNWWNKEKEVKSIDSSPK
jgi:hypothetical protein